MSERVRGFVQRNNGYQPLRAPNALDALVTREQVRFNLVSINQSCIFRVVQVIKSLHDFKIHWINDNVMERGLEQKCFKR